MNDRVYFADVRKEFVAETFALARALYKPRYVDEFYRRGRNFFAVVQRGEFRQPFVGDGNDAHIGLYGAKRIIGAFGASLRNGVEQCGFAYVGQPYDSKFHLLYLFRS